MWTSDTWQAVIYIVLLSASGSLIYTTNTVVWANYFGRLELGTITGFNTTMMVAFSALGAIPFGLMHDQTGSYDKALLMLIAMPAGSLLCALLATPPKKRLATLNK
jgi:MFS family permease